MIMGMTLEQLRIFVAVAERQHITRAAEALNLTQSAVSAAIAALEGRHDAKLFNRIGRGIELTEVGKAFLTEAKDVLSRVQTAELALAELNGLKRGMLCVQASQTIASFWLPRHLVVFRRAYPAIDIRLSIGNTAQVAAAIHAGTAELGFVEGEVLDPLLVSDESAKLYQALIKENQIASDVSGGFNYGLGNNFDYNGPMLYTFRVDYRPDLKGADVLKVVDKVISAVQEHGITEDELKQAKVNFRSSFLENLESQGGFGRADLLAALALYDDNPNRINTILSDLDKITTSDVQQAAKKYLVPTNRTVIDRRPEGGGK